MLSISKPLSAAKVSSYYSAEYSAANSNYYNESSSLQGRWAGQLTITFGLEGQQIRSEQFDRLALGKDPNTGEQLVKTTRAGHDLTFSAPKSVSLAALADSRIYDAHRAAVEIALRKAEELVQDRHQENGKRLPENTGKFIAALFDHTSARPVDGYSAAQLHTHAVVFNLTETSTGKASAIEPREIFRAAPMLTAVYQNHLERSLYAMGYTIQTGKNHAPEIAGFSAEYLASESKRSRQIDQLAEEKGLAGQAAKANLAHQTREAKLDLTPEEIRAAHLENAARFGNQALKISAAATPREYRVQPGAAEKAVEFARNNLGERSSVFEHHEVIREALRYARGRTDLAAIEAEIDRQKKAHNLITVDHYRPLAPLWRYTTPEAIEDERRVIESVVTSPARTPVRTVLDEAISARHPELNEWQRNVIRESLASERQISGINGAAGVGKSFSLGIVRELAEESGWKVYGIAPTSGAVKALKESGISQSETLQRFLLRKQQSEEKRLIFVDESSLVAARQMRQLLERSQPGDRILIVGDWRQHQSVEAGRIFEELQLAGMETARVNKLIRQTNPELREVIADMAKGRIQSGIERLDKSGAVHEHENRRERYKAIAQSYVQAPEGTLVISPDNESRSALNQVIRGELRARGEVGEDMAKATILVPKQEVTNEALRLAGSYEVGDVVKFRSGSEKLEIAKGTYHEVLARDRETNFVVIRSEDGKLRRFDPETFRSVSLYRPEVRQFAIGDRVQMTAPVKSMGLANRDTGTIVEADKSGNVRVKMDSGRVVGMNLRTQPHVEYGYVSTSHAAQGATVERVIMNVATNDSRISALLNRTLAYVGLSRARLAAEIYTDSKENLAKVLSAKNDNTMALSPREVHRYKGMAA